MVLRRATQPTNPKSSTTTPALAAALAGVVFWATACDLTPVPVQQAGGQANGGTASGGAPNGGDAGSTALGGSSAGSSTVGGAGGAGGGSAGGAAGTSGGTAAGAGGAPSGGAGGSTAGSGGAPAQGNLVVNGDFSQGDSLWHVDIYAGMETHSVMNGAFCLTLTQNASLTVGWPVDLSRAFVVSDGAAYQFSYQASVSGSPTSLTFQARVGPTTAGNGSFSGFSADETVGASVQTYQHSFTASGASPSAGVAFNIVVNAAAAVTVCIDNVSVSAAAN